MEGISPNVSYPSPALVPVVFLEVDRDMVYTSV